MPRFMMIAPNLSDGNSKQAHASPSVGSPIQSLYYILHLCLLCFCDIIDSCADGLICHFAVCERDSAHNAFDEVR